MRRIFSSLPHIWQGVAVLLALSVLVNTVWIGLIFWNENSDIYPAHGGIYSEGSVATACGIDSEGNEILVCHINPLLATTEAEMVLTNLIFSGLQKYDPTTGQIVDDLAHCEMDTTGAVYTCTLRSDITWHDGQALTLDDVLFTYRDLLQNPDLPNSSLRAVFDSVTISTEDEQSIQFTLEEPNAFFLSELTIGILPRHILGLLPVSNLKLADFNLNPVGSGPYQLESIKKDGNKWITRLTRSENCTHCTDRKLEKLVLHYYPDYTSLAADISLFNSVRGIPNTEIERFRNDSRFNLINYTLPQYVALFLNTSSDLLKNAKTRYALLLATDKSALADFADGEQVDTPFLSDASDFDIEYSEERARGALYDAGWQLPDTEGTTIRTKTIDDQDQELRLRLITSSTPPLYEQVARQVQAQWEKVGIGVEIQVLPLEDFQAAVLARDYDILLFGQNFGYNPDLSPFWHSQNAGNGQNFSELKNFTVDVMLEQARAQLNAEVRTDTFQKIAQAIAAPLYDANETLVNGVAAVFLYTPRFYYAVDQKIKGVNLDHLAFSADRFLGVGDWYIREEKQLKPDLNFAKVWSWFSSKF